jgi:DNA mismatch repair protein MutL
MAIQVLPPQLANQIAAGEVVERPASVVKELVENSLDAGATKIDIDIERGGAKLIRIRDNGCGINKEDLALALARHATSKIHSLDDLEAILSLGFRGEALASISSVSRLTLTSRTAQQNEAWQAYAEGRDMAVQVNPAAHPVGSTVEVLDLFYNTPARRKFLRSEKTEFTHIDEVVRRIALARFDVTISLSHNGKVVRQYRGVADQAHYARRLAAICGQQFVEHALKVEWQHDDLEIDGWVVDPAGARVLTDMQYCYVNQRMMKDRLINHAIRQAYQDTLHEEQQPAFVLYLRVDPHQVDVNVHPAKHEVRFHQSRLVHDFIYQAVLSVLQQALETQVSLPAMSQSTDTDKESPVVEKAPQYTSTRQSAGVNQFSLPEGSSQSHGKGDRANAKSSQPSGVAGGRYPEVRYDKPQGEAYQRLWQPARAEITLADSNSQELASLSAVEKPISSVTLAGHNQTLGRVLTIIQNEYALLERGEQLSLLHLPTALRWLYSAQLTPQDQNLRAQPLLIPLKLAMSAQERSIILKYPEIWQQMGIDLGIEQQWITLRAVPLPLRQQNLQKLIPELLGYLASRADITADQVAIWLARHLDHADEAWTVARAIQTLTDVERLCPQLVKSSPAGLLQYIDLKQILASFIHE